MVNETCNLPDVKREFLQVLPSLKESTKGLFIKNVCHNLLILACKYAKLTCIEVVLFLVNPNESITKGSWKKQ